MGNIRTLISEEELQERIEKLAKKITKEYEGKTVHIICVLKGAVTFMVDLAKKIDLDVRFDFMDVSSYEGTVSTGQIKINKDLDQLIEGEDVILVEDIIDTGRTLSYLLEYLKYKKPKSLKVCTLLDKPDRRVVEDLCPDYVGFVIPDEFVIGYGLDYNQKYRNLPYIGVLEL